MARRAKQHLSLAALLALSLNAFADAAANERLPRYA
jgi:hypothetical protein